MADSTAPRRWQEVTGARRITAATSIGPSWLRRLRLVVPDLGPDAPVPADCATATARGQAVGPPAYGWRNPGVQSAPNRVWRGAGWWWGMQLTGPMRYPDLAIGPLRAAALALLLAGCAEMAPPGTTTVRVEPRPDAEPPLARGETQLVVRAVSADAPGRDFLAPSATRSRHTSPRASRRRRDC